MEPAMVVIESLNLLLRFLLELGMLGAVGYWGFKTGDGAAMQGLLGIGGPLLMALVWGTFISPKAKIEVPSVAWIGLQAVLFGIAAVALASYASPALAASFLVVVVANGALMGALGSQS
jgi:hypothetical protein